MAKILLYRPRTDSEEDYLLLKDLAYRLTDLGHEVLDVDLELGKEIELEYRRAWSNADIIIALITRASLDSKYFFDELLQLRNYTTHSSNKLLIPVYTPGVDLDMLPRSIVSINGIRLEQFTSESVRRLSIRIDEAINLFLGKKIATEERAQEIKDKIEHSAPKYITETIKELNSRETYLKRTAFFWYCLGFLALLCGVGVAVWFSNNGLNAFAGKENWSITVFYAIKSVFIIVLLIAASKYSFNLAKSYMSESLKISDRIHAISFGKFYLQVLNQQIDPNELKEIFRDWNINNQTNNFSTQKAKDFDPKILENIAELVDKAKNIGKEK